MSGLEPLAIFGIACNVMQTISFAREGILTLKQIRKDGLIDPNLHKAADNIRTMTNTLADTIKGGNQEDAELAKMAKECSEIAKKLVAELDKLGLGITPGQQTVKKTIRLGMKKWWSKDTIEKLEKELSQIQRTMETRILIRLCNKNDALALEQEASFTKLNTVLQNFIDGRSRNETKLEALILVETGSIKNHTTSEHVTTRDRMKEEHQNTRTEVVHQVSSRINDLQLENLAKDERAQLLKSLNFTGRSKRICDIKEVKGKSFQWLFGDILASGVNDSHVSVADKNAEKDEIYERLMEECRKKTWHSFTSWLESDGNLYWITAKPGAGKSTLMKFLFEDPRTRQLLTKNGQRNALIISHSFFLMGTQMQCDIKGLLCNAIYQILQADDHGRWADELIRKQPEGFFQGRASDTDWSVGNLQTVLRALLKIVTGSCQVCIFLDGLDEVHKVDGKHTLLKLLKTLRTDFPLKMCVSSRLEVEFKQALVLEKCPALELHNLTAGDMYCCALDDLTSISEYLSDEDQNYHTDTKLQKEKLAEQIVQKADGVFLWARVAARSLQTAMTNGDTWSIVEQRLSIMPEELDRLFASMWNRHGENEKLYRAKAALYFNLVLDWDLCGADIYYSCWNPEHDDEYDDEHDQFCNDRHDSDNITLFQLALASHESFTENLGPWTSKLNIDFLWNELLKLYKDLPIVSAGLLEFSGPLLLADEIGHENADPDVEIRFIHRTAREFFTESIEGRKILEFDKSRFELRYCASNRAVLSRGLASQLPRSKTEPFYLPAAEVYTHGLASHFRNIDVRLQERGVRVAREKRFQEIDACQAFHNHGVGVEVRRWSRTDFLGVAAAYSSKDYVEHLFKEPMSYTPEYKNYVLVTGICFKGWHLMVGPDWHAQLGIVNYLLSWGYKSEPILVRSQYLCMKTGLEAFLLRVFLRADMGTFDSDEQLCDSIIETLQHFANSGADFMQPIYCYFRGGFLFGHLENHMLGLRRYDRNSTTSILVALPIMGILIQKFKTRRRSKKYTKASYFYQRLEEFVKTMNPDQRSVDLKIIAVGPYLYHKTAETWLDKSKRVTADRENILMDSLSKLIFWDDENSQSQMNDWQKEVEEVEEVTKSILDDDAILAGIRDYILYDCGFANSWPRALGYVLQDRYYTPDGKFKLPDGIVYPPIKYIDQSI